jgi:hypothetical protein
MHDLEQVLLETLSFFESMNKEQIYLQMESYNFEIVRDNTAEDLENSLAKLVKERKIKKVIINKEERWQKIFPKRPWWSIFKWW